ncbi:MAG: hypothetical protein WAT19_03320 [Ferruginibacter sp.]
MKKLFMLFLFSMLFFTPQAQNVGIGTTDPQARLHVTDSNVIFTAPAVSVSPTSFAVPVSGAGARMMWLPQKAAFRVGTVLGTQWDADSIGTWSFAAGRSVIAKADYSTAFGFTAKASGVYSFAQGYGALAMGEISAAMGFNCRAENTSTYAFGDLAVATGNRAISFSNGSHAIGDYSTAFGTATRAIGNYSLTTGVSNQARGNYASVFGFNNRANAPSAFAVGIYNDSTAVSPTSVNDNNPLFMVGNGDSDAARNNALTVYKSGVIMAKNDALVNANPASFTMPGPYSGTRLMWIPEKSAFRVGTEPFTTGWVPGNIGTWSFAAGYNNFASGEHAVAIGKDLSATGTNSIVMGYLNNATGQLSMALGHNAGAYGEQSHAIGGYTVSSGDYSTSIGSLTAARGFYSFAGGYSTTASGSYSSAMGAGNVSRAMYSTAIGKYNDSIPASSPSSDLASNPVLMVGNGTDDNNRHNAMTIYNTGFTEFKNKTTVTASPATFTYPTTSTGTKMMWIPEKSAFRVGTTTGIGWLPGNMGTWSFAAGYDAEARGNYSTSMGRAQDASGEGSLALGNYSNVTGTNAIGIGYDLFVRSEKSVCIGIQSQTYNNSLLSIGLGAISSGYESMAIGNGVKSTGDFSTSFGVGTVSRAIYSTAIGRYNDSLISSNPTLDLSSNPVLYVGNGNSNTARSNAMVVYKNGNTDLNGNVKITGNTDINGFTQMGTTAEGAPSIKMKKITGYNTPSSLNPNTWTFVPHGIADPSKILSISVIVTSGSYQLLPHSPDAGALFTVNTDPTGGGVGPSIAVGVKTSALSSTVMGRPIKILITYEE